MTFDQSDDVQIRTWDHLYQNVCDVLRHFGRPDSLLGMGDYSVYGDYLGHPQVKVTIGKLELLRPHVVGELQSLLSDLPGWEIIVAVADLQWGREWPEMGLKIRAHEIIDGLQRQHFPREFRDLRYKGARVGTENS